MSEEKRYVILAVPAFLGVAAWFIFKNFYVGIFVPSVDWTLTAAGIAVTLMVLVVKKFGTQLSHAIWAKAEPVSPQKRVKQKAGAAIVSALLLWAILVYQGGTLMHLAGSKTLAETNFTGIVHQCKKASNPCLYPETPELFSHVWEGVIITQPDYDHSYPYPLLSGSIATEASWFGDRIAPFQKIENSRSE